MYTTVRFLVYTMSAPALGLVLGPVLTGAGQCQPTSQAPKTAQQPTILGPVREMDILSCLTHSTGQKYQIVDFAVTDHGGYYLAVGYKQPPVFLLVTTDAGGTCLQSRLLPGKSSAVAARLHGGLFAEAHLWSGGQVRHQFVEYSDARLTRTTAFDAEIQIVNPVFVGDTLYGIDPRNRTIVRLIADKSGEQLRLDRGFSPGVVLGPSLVYYLAAAGDSALYVVEEGSNRVFRVEVATSRVKTFVLEAPELDAVMAKLPPQSRPAQREPGKPYELAILAVAASPAGDLYVALSRFKTEVGPTVVKFDPEGRKSTAFVLSRGAGGGTVMPASKRLSYLSGKLFLATDGGIVLGYDAD